MQGHLAFFTELAPTGAEIAERISGCISLLSSQNGTVAKEFLAAVIKASDVIDMSFAEKASAELGPYQRKTQ